MAKLDRLSRDVAFVAGLIDEVEHASRETGILVEMMVVFTLGWVEGFGQPCASLTLSIQFSTCRQSIMRIGVPWTAASDLNSSKRRSA